MKWICTVLSLASVLSFASCLTADEISQFGTSGDVDDNSGLTGWVKIEEEGDWLRLTSNGIPDHDAGPYPAKGNQNEIAENLINTRFAASPTYLADTTCVGGAVGIAKNGIPILSALTSSQTDAGKLETFDNCEGHPNGMNVYHYHQQSNCTVTGENEFFGIAFDGFPIYSMMTVTPDLDECRGHFVDGEYRYQATNEFPYTLGCYHGDVSHRKTPSECYFLAGSAEASTGVTTSAPVTEPTVTTRKRTTRSRTTRTRTTRKRTTRSG